MQRIARWLVVAIAAASGCASQPAARPSTPTAPRPSATSHTISPAPTPTAALTAPIPEGLSGMPGYAASLRAVNPNPNNPESIGRGFVLYKSYCLVCHGASGQGPDRKFTQVRASAPTKDLTEPRGYKYGSSDPAIYRTIMFGIPRGPMGNYVGILTEESVWDLVNYLKSRQPRP